SGGHVRDERGDEVGAHLAGALLLERQRAPLEVLEAAEAHADEDTGAIALFLRQVELGLFERHARRGHRERNEARDLLDLLSFHERGWIEVLHLGRDARRVLRAALEQGDGADPALTADQRLPARLRAHAVRRDEPHASDYDALHVLLGLAPVSVIGGSVPPESGACRLRGTALPAVGASRPTFVRWPLPGSFRAPPTPRALEGMRRRFRGPRAPKRDERPNHPP